MTPWNLCNPGLMMAKSKEYGMMTPLDFWKSGMEFWMRASQMQMTMALSMFERMPMAPFPASQVEKPAPKAPVKSRPALRTVTSKPAPDPVKPAAPRKRTAAAKAAPAAAATKVSETVSAPKETAPAKPRTTAAKTAAPRKTATRRSTASKPAGTRGRTPAKPATPPKSDS